MNLRNPQEATAVRIERFDVLDIGIHACHYHIVISRLLTDVKEKRKGYVTVTGVHGVMESVRNPQVRDAHNAAALNLPDGMPMVWIGKLQGHRVSRVYGPTLMERLCAASLTSDARHFLYGGRDGVVETLAANLRGKFPGIRIVGSYTPPFRELTQEELTSIAARINEVQADIIWVGLSTPKQELFMNRIVPSLNKGVLIGVGAAFDFHIGAVRQAPRWMQQIGMEWLFRLAMEPRRLWKRYLLNNPTFVCLLVSKAVRNSFKVRIRNSNS